jgi:LysR family nitrogen assimilation transcriptional regulator
VAKAVTVPLLREVRKRMPEAEVSITEGLSVAMHEALVTGRLDTALLYNAVQTPDVEVTPLLEEPLFLIQRRTVKEVKEAKDGRGAAPKRIPLREVAMSSRRPATITQKAMLQLIRQTALRQLA